MSRERYIFRGCLLLIAVIIPILAGFLSLIAGKPPDVLNRLGIILEVIGILAVTPDIIGEERLQKAISDVKRYEKTQQYIREYLYSSQETTDPESLPFLATLSLTGNFVMSLLMIWSATAILFSNFRGSWIGIALLLAFGFLGIEAVTWIVLLLLFLVFRSLVHRMPNLFSYFLATNSLISALGVLISSALAYALSGIIPLLIYIAKLPVRKTLAAVTLPFIFLGLSLQFAATFF